MKIAFVYSEGRNKRDPESVPSEFFYGYREFQRLGFEVAMIETGPEVSNFWTKVYNVLFRRFTPARTNGSSFYQALSLLRELRDFDCVVATYAQAGLGLGLWKNLGRLPPALVGIQCGLVNYPLPHLRRRFTAWLLQRQFIALFASSELAEMKTRYKISEERIRSCEFGVDLAFWRPAPAEERENYVLAVGNDGRRDYKTLVVAAADCPCEVRIVTKRKLPDQVPANVKIWRGDWHRQALSDEELRTQYQKALCVVVPLLESIQPSGQSVAMQAMACGTPVILTRTTGYWGDGWLKEDSDLLLVPPGSPRDLAAAINRLRSDPNFSGKIGIHGREALCRQGGADHFAQQLLELCRQAVAEKTNPHA